MSLHSLQEGHPAVAAQNTSQIPTVLICGSVLVREGIKHLLANTQFQIQDDAIDRPSGFPSFPDAKAILFLLETSGGPAEVAELIRELKAQGEAARVVLLADSFDRDFLVHAYQAGAAGVLHTATAPQVLIKSLELIVLGEDVFPAAAILSASNGMAHALQQEHQHALTEAGIDGRLPEGRGLSQREHEILRSLMEGAPNKVIARKLGMAEATVKVHIKAILRKVRAQNRTQAAMWATTHLLPASDKRPG